ncbi:MAG: integrase/recombinase XerD [Bryobacterales bacterium]|nr:integrase/recombinase XerD [Bryobacterales bacterium]
MGKQSLSRDELLAILAAARAKRERDWLMILVAFAHGLRATEVVQLARDNFADGFITVQRLKGSKRTTQPLIEHENELLNERKFLFDYALKCAPKQRLFPLTRQRFWQIVQEYGASAGIPEHLRHPHVMKHTIGMQMIHSAGIENTRQYLGHESISSTGEYLIVGDDDASAAARAALKF